MKTEEKLIEEIRAKYGSVSKMIAIVQNKAGYLKEYGGYIGRDGGETIEHALREIPSQYHIIYYKYHISTYKP